MEGSECQRDRVGDRIISNNKHSFSALESLFSNIGTIFIYTFIAI